MNDILYVILIIALILFSYGWGYTSGKGGRE